GSIQIVKQVAGLPPAAAWQFNGSFGEFTLPATGGQTTPYTGLVPGDYTISETAVPGYAQLVSCTGGVTGTDSVTVHLEAGADIVCTFTNTALAGSVTIVKELIGAVPPAVW